MNYIINAGYYLESFLGQDVLHHFGNGIFGFIEENADEDQAKNSEKIYLAGSDVRVFNVFI